MTARIFISYRSADGMDKAVALARELGRQFGDAQVFLDKDDLRGGSAWRAEIGETLAQRPVLLLLLTPQLIEAVDASGKLRIADPADPIRRELESAMASGAQVIPLICDGLNGPPDASRLPEPFNRIGELTWRKLRAYDWEQDIERLVADLLAFGVAPVPPAVPAPDPATAPVIERRRSADVSTRSPVALWLAGAAGVALLAGAAFWWLRATSASSPALSAPAASSPALPTPAPLPSPAPAPAQPAPAPAPAITPPAVPGSAAAAAQARRPQSAAASVAGRWSGKLSRGEQVTLVVTQWGNRVTLVSEPIPIATRADWAEYRAFWRERFGRELAAVVYRGEGQFVVDPGAAPRIDIALKLHPSPGGFDPIDGGNLSATLSPDGRALSGTIWLNSLQTEQPATLKRKL